VKFALPETSGPFRNVFEQPEQPSTGVCHEGIAMPSGETPPPLSAQAVSDAQGPPALAVVRSVPPTETIFASSAGQASFDEDQAELSPDAAKKFWPCEAICSKYGSRVLGSAGVQPHEQLICFDNGASVVETIALMQAVSLILPDPLALTLPQTYI
jgi:hypothetical protein